MKSVATSGKLYVLAVAVALLVVAAGVSYAAIPGTDGTISACYEKDTGKARIYDAATNLPKGCGPKELPVSWNVQGPPGDDGVSGHQVVTLASANDSVDFKVVTVTCPSGKVPVGGGGAAVGFLGFAPDGVGIQRSDLVSNGTGWVVAANEIVPTAFDWTLVARVICVTA